MWANRGEELSDFLAILSITVGQRITRQHPSDAELLAGCLWAKDGQGNDQTRTEPLPLRITSPISDVLMLATTALQIPQLGFEAGGDRGSRTKQK